MDVGNISNDTFQNETQFSEDINKNETEINKIDVNNNKNDSDLFNEYLDFFNSSSNINKSENTSYSENILSNNSDVNFFSNETLYDNEILRDNSTYNITLNSTNSTITENKGCELLGNFGYIVQLILAIMCFSILVCKI